MPENTAPTETSTPSGFNFHKVLAAVGIILVVTIIAGAAWYFYQTNYNQTDYGNEKVVKVSTSSAKPVASSDETTNWQTYTFATLGFSLKLPPDWEHSEAWVTSETIKSVLFGENLTDLEETAIIGALQESWPGNLRVTVDTENEYQPLEYLEGEKFTSITLAGEKAAKNFRITASEGPRCMCTRIYVNHVGKGYLIEFLNKDDLGNYDKIYDTILSTFKFL